MRVRRVGCETRGLGTGDSTQLRGKETDMLLKGTGQKAADGSATSAAMQRLALPPQLQSS